jgi:hypothetical protein
VGRLHLGSRDDSLDLQREFGNLAVARWITQRAGIRRLTADEAREHTESREERIAQSLRWFAVQPVAELSKATATVSQAIAAILGLSAEEQRMAARYGDLLPELGLQRIVDRIQTAPDVEDRTRSALELTIRLVNQQLAQRVEG